MTRKIADPDQRACGDTAEATVQRLTHELGEARYLADALWSSTMDVDRILGIEGLHPRLVAHMAQERLGYRGRVEEGAGSCLYVGRHVLGDRCPGDRDSCLSGLAEASVGKMTGEAVNAEDIRLLPDGLCEVVLVPARRRLKPLG